LLNSLKTKSYTKLVIGYDCSPGAFTIVMFDHDWSPAGNCGAEAAAAALVDSRVGSIRFSA
jgi:hypothetical protein